MAVTAVIDITGAQYIVTIDDMKSLVKLLRESRERQREYRERSAGRE